MAAKKKNSKKTAAGKKDAEKKVHAKKAHDKKVRAKKALDKKVNKKKVSDKKVKNKKTHDKKMLAKKKASRKSGKAVDQKAAARKKQPAGNVIQQTLPEKQEITFSYLWATLKDFLNEFKTPIAWLFVLMCLIFATKSLEVIRAMRNQVPLFNFLSGFFKDVGGIFGHPASRNRYLIRIPAILYQLVIPVIVLWIIYYKTKLSASSIKAAERKTTFEKMADSFRLMSTDYGLSPAPLRLWGRYLLFIFLIMLPFIVIFAGTPAFKNMYPYLRQLKNLRASGRQFAFSAIMLFLLYESIRVVYMFSWEFLFRGLMLNAMREKYKYHAIFIQTIPYVLLHSTKPSLELYYTIPTGLLLGLLAYRSGSIWPGFLLHAGGAVIFDLVTMYF